MNDIGNLKRHVTNGYYRSYFPSHHLANKAGIVYEHMMVAEDMLGRELKAGEVVHHKDGNRKNNSHDNLMVFKTHADHAAYHKGRDIELDGDVYVSIDESLSLCPLCGKQKYKTAKICLSCRQKEQAKNIPPKDELYSLLQEHSMCAIGRLYNVSDNAVRKWCKKYDLPFKRKEIKKFREQVIK